MVKTYLFLVLVNGLWLVAYLLVYLYNMARKILANMRNAKLKG